MESGGIQEKFNMTLNDHVNRSNLVDFEEEEKKARQRVLFLEASYSKMEAEYNKKIKELKSVLKNRMQRQHALRQQLTQLALDLKQQDSEIQKVAQQLKSEHSAEEEMARHKVISMKGTLLKRASPEIHKKASSPGPSQTSTTNQIHNILQMRVSKKEVGSKDKSDNTGTADTIKRPTSGSAGRNRKPIKLVPKQLVTNEKVKVNGYSPLNKALQQQQNQASPQSRRKEMSPKAATNKLKELFTQKTNDKKTTNNGSPRRVLRASPGPQRKERKLLGMKEAMEEEEAF